MKIEPIDPSRTLDTEGNPALCRPSSFLQTPFWAGFKAGHGWKPLFFRADADGVPPFLLTVLVRNLFRITSLAYIPLGPDLPCTDPAVQGKVLEEIAAALKPYLPRNTLCVRFDPPWGTAVPNAQGAEDETAADGEAAAAAAGNLFPRRPLGAARPAPGNIQPPDTVILDLTKPDPVLLSEMKGKWRYNIKLGEKKGVTIRCLEGAEGATTGVDIFYSLYIETAKRDGIAIHARSYYADLVRRAADTSEKNCSGQALPDCPVRVRVYVAEHESVPIASIITLFCGDEAVYLYGASSNEKRNLMPAYSLQWKAIRDAREAGCRRYDFYGIPPTGDPGHPMHGLYRFKTGFGGIILHRIGSLDLPYRPVLYGTWRLMETCRSFWFKKVVKFLRRETPRKS